MVDFFVGYVVWVWYFMYVVSDDYVYLYEELVILIMMLWIQGLYGNMRIYKEFYKVSKFVYLIWFYVNSFILVWFYGFFVDVDFDWYFIMVVF